MKGYSFISGTPGALDLDAPRLRFKGIPCHENLRDAFLWASQPCDSILRYHEIGGVTHKAQTWAVGTEVTGIWGINCEPLFDEFEKRCLEVAKSLLASNDKKSKI